MCSPNGNGRASTSITTSSWNIIITALPTNWWARKSMSATQGARWKSYIRARAQQPTRQTLHAGGASAQSASEVPGMDAFPHRRMGGHDRAVHGATGGKDYGRKAASGAGISLLHGFDRAGAALRQRAPGSRGPTRYAPPGAQLSEREIDSGAGPGPAERDRIGTPGTASGTRQHPRRDLLRRLAV